MHCSKSESTADFLGSLKKVLEAVESADFYLLGVDSNVEGEEAASFQEKLRDLGFNLGPMPAEQAAPTPATR